VRSALRAQTRGGLAAAAAFLERAASLTIDPRRRAERELAAAQAHHQAGAPEPAVALLARARAGPLDDLRQAQAQLLRAQIAFTSRHGGDAPALLLEAARRLEPLDATLARETYLEALMAGQLAGRLDPTAAARVARAARAAPRPPAPRAPDVLLDAVAVMLTEGHAVAAPLLKTAVARFREDDSAATGGLRWFWPAEEAAIEVWDHDSWHDLAARELRLVRQAGALTILPLALTANVVAETFAGRLAAAASLIDELNVAVEATASPLAPHGGLSLAAWRGREAEIDALTAATFDHAERVGDGLAMSTAHWANALLHNSLGQYDRAAAAAEQLLDFPGRLDATVAWGMPELVEAAARSGDAGLAEDALDRLATTTRPAGTDWGLGLEARSRALTRDGHDAESLYREAVARLGRTRVRGEYARAHLLYGEWLRREGRRVDAREQLRTAHRMFTEMGMQAFAERAGREVLATGATVRRRAAEARDELTAQEGQIARLAADGLTNPEIGARLFLSPRTVEWHLRKVYAKLDVRNRAELARVVRSQGPDVAPAGSATV
jgi:DNA-binding CsgD family transcriptional regulator